MKLKSLRTACVAATAIAPMIFIAPAGAANDIEQARQPTLRPIDNDSNWSLRLPKDDIVVYKGVVSFDAAGVGSAPILYPAPNAVGLLAAVITHGLIVESSKKAQKDKLQEAADQVLSPYQAVLSNYKHKELMQRGLEKTSTGGGKRLVEFSDRPDSDWFIESAPTFSITQDQSVIILDNAISIYARDAAAPPAFQNSVRVISQAKVDTDLARFWTADQGEKLKEESAALFAESLDIALREVAGGSAQNSNAFKTIRYVEGSTEKMERAQIISERCNRVVIKTLRGSLMSVPSRQGVAGAAAADQCASASNSPK